MSAARNKAYLALIASTILWGVAPPLVKGVLEFTTPFRWLLYRYTFAVIVTFPFLIFYLRKYKLKPKQLLTIICLEMIGTTTVLGLLYKGLQYSSALDVSLIAAIAPLFVVVGSVLFLKEKEEKREWLGLTLALIGTLIITLEPLITHGKLSNGSSVFGNGLIFLHNIAWTIYLVFAKRAYKKIPKMLVTMISFWVGAVSFAILSMLTTSSFIYADLAHPLVVTSALYMAIPGSVLAATFYLYGQNVIEVSEAALFTYLQPLISIPLALWWLGEKITLSTFIGIGIIIIGVYLAERRQSKV